MADGFRSGGGRVRLLLLILLSPFCCRSAFSAERPNVLFIAIDDLRTALGCYGDPLAKSPNMDRFAATARRFEHAYTQQAVCGPSRTSLLTGRLPDNTRVWHNRNLFRDTCPDLVTLPQLFKNNGYQALALGKIFSGDERELDPVSWSAPEVLKQPGWSNYVLREDTGKGKGAAYEAADVPDDGYSDGKLATLAVGTLEKLQQKKEPFFLAVGFFKPHLPFSAPQKYWDLYDPAVFALPEQTRVKGAPEIAYHTHRELGGYQDVPEDERVSAAEARTLRHGYYACVSYVDAQVGRLLDALRRLGLEQNTIVVLWGDHGWSLGEKARWCKATNFERDTRVPLMVRVPGLAKPGVPSRALIECVDIYPTLAALAGLAPPADLDGRSFVPVLQDPGARGRDVAFSQFNRPWKADSFTSMGYSLRTATQRYTRWVEWPSRKTITEEFYDYTSKQSATRDGGILIEQENVVAESAHAASLNRLRARLDESLATRITVNAVETPATTAPARALDPAEQRPGFVALADGKSFAGWKHSGNWEIQDGAFARVRKGGPLTYERELVPDDFELRFDWKVSPGCNSGVYYRPGQVEYQVLDDENSSYGENPRQSAASLFFCMAPGKRAARPAGQWNTARILCKGSVIEHWLNEERVLSFDYTDPKWAREVGLLRIRGGDLTGRGGKLWLQDHGQDVAFRNLRLRTIPAEERLAPDPAFQPLPVTGAALEKENARVRQMRKARDKQ